MQLAVCFYTHLVKMKLECNFLIAQAYHRGTFRTRDGGGAR